MLTNAGPKMEKVVEAQKRHHAYAQQPENRLSLRMVRYPSDMWTQVMKSAMVWFTMFTYLVTISAVRYGPPAFHDFFDNGFFRPSGNMLGAIGVGVFFFITTFFDKALERYYSLYRFTGMMEGRIYDIVMAFQAHCEDGNARHQQYLQQLWRYVVARSPAPQRPCLGTLGGGS